MERYDGKTARDDRKKYILIAAGVVVLIVAWCLLLHFFGKTEDPEPDYRVVYSGDAGIDDDTAEYLEEYIGEFVGDRNGDGVVAVEILSVALDPEDYANASSAFLYLGELMVEEDIYLVLLTDEPEPDLPFDGLSTNYCGQEDYFIDLPTDLADTDFSNRAQLNSSNLFQYLGYGDGPLLYGSILEKDDEAETALALALLEEMVLGSTRVNQPYSYD